VDANPTAAAEAAPRDFLRAIVSADVRSGAHDGRVITRFPPEPNGYLHIGHAKSICLNFGIAQEFGGRCHLRFDDTNPETEEQEYVDSIMEAVRWLGFDWGEHLYFGSDYFDRMYEAAEHLVRNCDAYVDDASEEEIRAARGTVMTPGTPTPSRNRSGEENLDLLRRMRAGEFASGSRVLRARIDLASPNMLMRDPVLYRIRHATHYRQGATWCIYPLYDYAHPLEDAFECVTHSLCTLEFENNRELYDWVVEHCPVPCTPRQYEFARLELDYTVMSKRKLLDLVKRGLVRGWDDPRMPTIAGLRRRGVTPESIRAFADLIGVAKTNSRVDIAKLEYSVRDDLNHRAPRVMAVLNPLRVTLTNWPAGHVETIDAPHWPHDVPRDGSRPVPFSGRLLIERDDFSEDPPKGFFRLAPGREVRLRYGYIIRCDDVIHDDSGDVIELRCTYDPETRGGQAREGREVKGTVHWVSEEHALSSEVRLYDRLFSVPDPGAAAGGDGDITAFLNPDSLVVVPAARVEPAVRDLPPESHVQFERLGYFITDRVDSNTGQPVFNRTVTLRDTWAKRSGAVQEDVGRPLRKTPPAQKRAAGPAPAAPVLDVRARVWVAKLGLAETDAAILSRDDATARLFEGAVAAGAPARAAANWIIHELPRELAERSVDALPFDATALAALVRLTEDGTISSSAGREVLAELARTGGDPRTIVETRGLAQVSDAAALAGVVDDVLHASPERVAAWRDGRTGLMGYFIGQVMSRTGGRANPEVARKLLEERLQT
jgi:glutaminyl-tRNA synthetase